VARILQVPFQLALDGSIATVDQASEDADRQQIAVLCVTRAGERRLRPGFGLTDPTFAGFNASELAAKLELYGPPVDLEDVRIVPETNDLQRVTIEFQQAAA
jgi:hypothetical protein